MAHPYSSTSLYAGTPSYAPQQPYYPSFPSNGLQQPINTPPGIPQQLPQPQGQMQTLPSYPPQPSPATNGPRFDANSQIRPPAPPFHPFPPPTTTFNSDFFKQFASAGFPPPPPPNFPPVPIPGAAYPQLPGPVNTSLSSPYPQHVAAGAPVFGAGFNSSEQPRQHAGDQFIGSRTGSRGGMDVYTDTQAYGTAMTVQSGISHPAHPLPKGTDSDKDQTLPSFGSRSDLDMLFASAQKQSMLGSVEPAMIASQPKDTNSAPEPDLAADGNVSPYDPTRPAAINDRASGGFASSSRALRSANLRPVERTYDNKSLIELRQLAKGAVLSLVPHKILYPDLVKEGVNPQILNELYEELGLRIEAGQSQARDELQGEQHPLVDGKELSAASQQPATQQPKVGFQKATPRMSTAQPTSQPSTIPSPSTTFGPSGVSEATAPSAGLDLKNLQPAQILGLERKDRIAQLLAAKTGRPTPTPTLATLAQSDGPKTTPPTTVSAETTSVGISWSSPQTRPAQLPEPVAATTGASGTKPKAQTELVKQKMEQLRREAQARTGGTASEIPADTTALGRDISIDASRILPEAESIIPSSANKISSIEKQLPMPSLIPGLFMTSTESSGFDEAARSVVGIPMSSAGGDGQENATAESESSVGQSDHQLLSSSTVPAKRPSDSDTAIMDIPLPKKPNTQQNLQYAPSLPLPDSEADYQSEGEIVEEPGSDAMAMGSDSDQDMQEDYTPPVLIPTTSTSFFNKPTSVNQTSTTALRTTSTSESGKDELYRAKQSEIEAMRRKIAELEQRNKLKRTRSQVESPSSSNPPTPAVTREDQQLASSPIPQTADLPGVSRPSTQRLPAGPSVPPVISKLTPAQLQEREAVLKQALLRQRAQRQQVLQEGLPDLNAKVKKTETRLEDSRTELAQVRAQLQNARMALDRLEAQEKRLVKEVSQFEEQLQEGRSGQKRYSDELQQIKLEKLAEAQAVPTKEGLIGSPDQLHPATSTISEPQSDLSNGHLDNQDENLQRQQSSLSVPAESVAARETFDAEVDANMNGENTHESPGSYNAQGTLEGGIQPAQSLGVVNHAQHLQADEMEISPEPEDYVETHEHLPENVEVMQTSDEAMDVDNDSNGSASMSGSDDEEEYEPADVDTSEPVQQSADESDEYDPETAPVDSATPTTVPEDGLQDFHETSEIAHASGPSTETGNPFDGGRDVSGATESDASNIEADDGVNRVGAVSEVPANTKDDLESGDQLTDADTLVRPPPGLSRETDGTPFLDGTCPAPTHYVPYKTPLSAFKTYRFHSDYPDAVKSGYRSLTYSNNIDPTRPLCPAELSGEACKDPACEEQHFAQLELPDEKILVQLSSASDIKDKSTRDEFHAGLKQVIAELRAKEVKDFEKVAAALSLYRRKFFTEKKEKERQEDDDSPQQGDQEHHEHQEQEVLDS
ncbi:putative zinc-finger domain-containing protein [Cladophialophora immunda]|nr:putative zinc-finger domain-containing protein [Cladophialophora immunda]